MSKDNIDFGMDDLPPLPDFLQRPWTKEEKERQRFIAERNADRRQHPGKYIVRPSARIDPVREKKAANRREMPTRDKGGEKIKVIHPTTEAIKDATKHLKNGKKREALYMIARENKLDPLKWDHLNVGQVSMNLSNVLRGRYYRMKKVTINGVEIP